MDLCTANTEACKKVAACPVVQQVVPIRDTVAVPAAAQAISVSH